MRHQAKDSFPVIHTNDIWLADLPKQEGSRIQYGIRPVVIVSNETVNRFSPVVTAVPLTSNRCKEILPTHVYLSSKGLNVPSIALCDQTTSVDKSNLLHRLGHVDKPFEALALRHGLAVQLGLTT